jgi:putative phosphoesterase
VNEHTHLVGVISDTHGMARPQIADLFEGVERIVHAGDVGSAVVLEILGGIAPVVAVRGNVDSSEGLRSLPRNEMTEIGDVLVYVLHDLHQIDLDPSRAGVRAVIHGHTHRPSVETHGNVLYLNPGSAGPRRPARTVSAALLRITGTTLTAEIRELEG